MGFKLRLRSEALSSVCVPHPDANSHENYAHGVRIAAEVLTNLGQ